MEILQRFMAYASDFETTLADDRWDRLEPHFCDDAVYEVNGTAAACRIEGRPAILAGMKKSLDGFDRKFTRRDVEITDGPHIDGDQMRAAWKVVYHRDGCRPFELRGESVVRYRDDRITALADTFGPNADTEMAAWQSETGVTLDPSYT